MSAFDEPADLPFADELERIAEQSRALHRETQALRDELPGASDDVKAHAESLMREAAEVAGALEVLIGRLRGGGNDGRNR
ncbi:MAG TPA: hypothetical protein DEH78_27595 [Solibacterales bacterium]|nr:hypothetical protein [Bryobacterales bacterium]